MSVNHDSASAKYHHQRRLLTFGLGVVLVGANLRAPITSVGPLLPAIQETFGLSESQAGLLNSLPLFIFAVLSLMAPAVAKRLGIERTIAAGMLILILGIVMRSAIPDAIGLWLGTAILSVGIAFGNVLLPGLVKRETPNHASSLIGAYAAGMAAAAGIAAGVAEPLAAYYNGSWRLSLGWSVALAILGLVVWLPQCKVQRHRKLVERAQTRPPRSPWATRTGWIVALFFACHSSVFYSLVSWYPTYVAADGVPMSTAGIHLLAYQVIAVSSNLVCGPIISRSRQQVGLGLACGFLLCFGTIGIVLHMPFPVLWLGLAGIGAGVAMTTSLSLFALRTRDTTSASRLSGMAQFVGYVGAAAGPVAVGVLRQISNNWSIAMTFTVAASALALLTGALAGRDRNI